MTTKRPGWHRKGPTRYRVVDLVAGDVWDCETPRQVALLMWGRDIKEYAYFKDRTRFETDEADMTLFEEALEAFRPAEARQNFTGFWCPATKAECIRSECVGARCFLIELGTKSRGKI